jgi:hypothetical protein
MPPLRSAHGQALRSRDSTRPELLRRFTKTSTMNALAIKLTTHFLARKHFARIALGCHCEQIRSRCGAIERPHRVGDVLAQARDRTAVGGGECIVALI